LPDRLSDEQGHVFLLLQTSADTVDLVRAKLFEYLRTGRPVLAVEPDGATVEYWGTSAAGGWSIRPIAMSCAPRSPRHTMHGRPATAIQWSSIEPRGKDSVAGPALAAHFDALVGPRA
jgi:hypothetical protein